MNLFRSTLIGACLLLAAVCHAQPTGSQKLYLEITDHNGRIPFEQCFKADNPQHKLSIQKYRYKLSDIGPDPSGFRYYPQNRNIHKTLMTDDHQIEIIRDFTDTMQIDLRQLKGIYFLRIPFQPGQFRLIVDEGWTKAKPKQMLPLDTLQTGLYMFDISPADWTPFRLAGNQPNADYRISTHFAQQNLLSPVVEPEQDPNFRNLRRVSSLKKELADYNFDGQVDYREHQLKDTSRWNYFIYRNQQIGFELDTLLSSFHYAEFDFVQKKMLGGRTKRLDELSNLTQQFEWISGRVEMTQYTICSQVFRYSERTDCSVYRKKNGEWVLVEFIEGPE